MQLRLGVVIEDTWAFFNEIYARFTERFQTEVFTPNSYSLPIMRDKVNNYIFHRDLNAFLQKNDVIFSEWSSGLLAEITKLPKTCGIVTRLHRFELYQWADKIAWDNVDKIILVSRAKECEFVSAFPSQAGKTIVIPEAVSLEKFRRCSREFSGNIGILGNLTPRKRVYELILAFFELTQLDDRFYLHIGGAKKEKFNDYYYAVQALVKKLNLEDKVIFYGRVSNPEEWYKNIDIFVSNSYSEGLQVSPLEAMASGCYCLAHNWDGADEMLPEENLYLTNTELLNKILQYSAESPLDRQTKIDVLQAIVRKNFDMLKISEDICRLVEDVGAVT